MTNVSVSLRRGPTERTELEAAVTPMPLDGIGAGWGTSCAPAGAAAPQTQNQGWPVSRATKTPFAGLHATVSRASVMPRCSENQTGRRSVLTAN